MTLPATIYARFSSQEQSLGSSKSRQLDLCRDMIARRGWQWSSDRELVDEGLSAFIGANRAPGGLLYTFEQEAEAGRYRSGHVLVVENLDRISRQGYDAVLPFLQKLTSQGVTVATVDGDRIYAAHERVQLASVIEAVVKSELSREESEKKSKRLKAAQHKRISAAQENAGQHISQTATVPGWIEAKRISKATERPAYKMALNQPRVAILREIFQLTIDGYGTPSIARMLNERGEPVWSHLGQRSNNGWTVGYLTKLVLNRAVLGEYRPKNRPRGAVETEKGIVILNHYPQAIDPVTFAKAQTARRGRKGSSGAWQITHNNLFSGIATCGVCGGRMKQEFTVQKGRVRKHKNGRYPAGQNFSYLKCHNALNRVWDEGAGQLRCDNRNWIRYERLESAVVEFASGWLALHRQGTPSADVRDLEVQVAEAQRFLDDKQVQADNAALSFTRTGSATMERLMLQLESEMADQKAQVEALHEQLIRLRSSTPSGDFLVQIEEQRRALASDDDDERNRARVAMKQTLRGIIKSMECMPSKNTRLVLGDDAVGLLFDGQGDLIQNVVLQKTIYGPDGEIDWHPDYPDAEYQYAE